MKNQFLFILAFGFLAFADDKILAHDFSAPMENPNNLSQSNQANLIKNIHDENIFHRSSFLKKINIEDNSANIDPKFYLKELIKTNPDFTFSLDKKEKDRDISVTHFQQMYKSIPVFGGIVLVRTAAKEKSAILTGYFFKDIKIPTTPIYLPPTLINIAQKALNGGNYLGKAVLGILPADDKYHLSYKINIFKSLTENWTVYLDAFTGNILRAVNKTNSPN